MAYVHEIPQIIKRAIRTGTNILLTGNPGIGKTSVIEKTHVEIKKVDPDFGLWILYLSAMSPLDVQAVVPDMDNRELVNFFNKNLPNRYDNPNTRGILWLGESNNADPATNKVLQKYINNEDMGGLQKPEGVVVISDSNSLKHKSGAVQQSLALLSRSRHIEIEVCPDSYLEYLAETNASEFVRAYLSIRKDHVDSFAKHMETRTYGVWANPRSWERLSNSMLDATEHKEELTNDEVIGDVGEAVGKEFLAFLKVAKTLVKYEDVIKKPKTCVVPEKSSDTYAVIAMLATSTKVAHLDNIRIYTERFPVEVQVLYHMLLANSGSGNRAEVARSKEYAKWFRENTALTDAILS